MTLRQHQGRMCRAAPSHCNRKSSAAFPRQDIIGPASLSQHHYDPTCRDQVGNFPHAFRHIGLVNAAWALADADGHFE